MGAKNTSAKVYLMLFLCMVLFGSATSLSKLVTSAFPVFIAGGVRVLLAFLVLFPFIKLANIKNYRGRDRWLLLGIAVFGILALPLLCYMV